MDCINSNWLMMWLLIMEWFQQLRLEFYEDYLKTLHEIIYSRLILQLYNTYQGLQICNGCSRRMWDSYGTTTPMDGHYG